MATALDLGVIAGTVELNLSAFDEAMGSVLDGVASISDAFDSLDGLAEGLAANMTAAFDDVTASIDAQAASVDTLSESYDRLAASMNAAASGNIRAVPASYSNDTAPGAAAAPPTLDTGGASESLGGLDAAASGVDASMAAMDASVSATEATFSALDGSAISLDEALTTLDDATTAASAGLSALDEAEASAAAGITTMDDRVTSAAASMEAATASTEANTAATQENAAASDEAAAGHAAMGESAGGASKDVGLLGLAVGAATYGFLKLGMEGQDAFTTVNSLTGASAQQMALYQQQGEQLALSMGESMKQVGDGLYYVASAGFTGAQALEVLKPAMEDAKAGGVDLSITSDALTSALNAYGAGADQATHYSDIMLEAVTQGKQTFQDFAGSVGMAAVTGHTAGFSFMEVAAAEATMTQSGLNAHRAVMQLDFLMRSIGLSAQTVADKAKKLGYQGFDVAKFSSMSLIDKLEYLRTLTKGNTADFEKLVGGANGLSAAEILLAKNGDTYNGILEKMRNSSGATQAAFDKSEQTISAGLQHIGAALSVLAYQVVIAVTPAVTAALTNLSGVFSTVSTFIGTHTQLILPVLAALGVLIGTILVAALNSFIPIAEVASAIFSPWTLGIALAVGALALFGPALANAASHAGPLQNALTIMQQLADNAGHILQWVGSVAAQDFAPILDHLATLLSGRLSGALSAVVPLAQHLNVALSSGMAAIADITVGALNTLSTILSGPLLSAILNNVTAMGQHWLPILSNLASFFTGPLLSAIVAFMPHLEALVTALASGIGPVVVNAWGALNKLASVILAAVLPAVESLLPYVQTIATWLADHLTQAVNALAPQLQQAVGAVSQFADQLGTRLGPALHNVFDFLELALGILGGIWNTIWPSLATTLGGVWNVIKGIVMTAWAIVSGIIKIGLDLLGGNWGQAWNDLKDMLGGIWSGIQTILSGAWQTLLGLFQQQGAILRAVWNGIWNGLTGIVSGILDSLKNTFLTSISTVLQALTHIPGPVGDMASKALASIEQLRSGSNNKLADTAKQAAIHAGELKTAVLTQTAQMHAKAASELDQQRQDILTQLANTTDPAQRHALEMRLKVVTQAEIMHADAAAAAEGMAHDVAQATQKMRDQSGKDAQKTHDNTVGPLQGLPGAVGGFFSGIGTTIHTQLTNLQSWLSARWDDISGKVNQVWQNIHDTIGGWLDKIKTWIQGKVQDIVNAVSGPFNTLKETLSNIWNFISGVFRVVGEIIFALVKKAWDAISGKITEVVNGIKQWLSDRWNDISTKVGQAWDAVRQTISDKWNQITDTVHKALQPLLTWLSDRWNDIKNTVGQKWDDIKNTIGDKWTQITSFIQSKAGDLKNAILKPFNDAKDAIGGVVKGFANNGINLLNKAITGWQDLGNDLGSAINDVAKAVGVKDRVPAISLPQIPLLAKGTQNFGGGLAIVGEEGPEMVHLPQGASVLPAVPTASLLRFGLGFLRGVPGFSGGVGDFFGNIGNTIGGGLGALGAIKDKIGGALGDLSQMISDGPAAIVKKALDSVGFNPNSFPGILSSLAGGALSALTNWIVPFLQNLLNGASGAGGALTYSGPGGFAGAANFSEFHGYNGDCGETAELLALHVLKGATLTASSLNAIVHRDQAAGWAGGNGYITIGGIRSDLSRFEHLGSQSFAGGQWLSVLDQWAGKKPIIFLYSNAGGGLPGDERGVQWHFNTNLGSLGGGKWLFGDGDNSLAASGKLNIYSSQNLAMARPYSEIVVGMADGGILMEPVAGVGLASGTRYLMGEAGPEAVIPLSGRRGLAGGGEGGDTYHITVEVTASADDGEPYTAGQQFGAGFAASLAQAKAQRGL